MGIFDAIGDIASMAVDPIVATVLVAQVLVLPL